MVVMEIFWSESSIWTLFAIITIPVLYLLFTYSLKKIVYGSLTELYKNKDCCELLRCSINNEINKLVTNTTSLVHSFILCFVSFFLLISSTFDIHSHIQLWLLSLSYYLIVIFRSFQSKNYRLKGLNRKIISGDKYRLVKNVVRVFMLAYYLYIPYWSLSQSYEAFLLPFITKFTPTNQFVPIGQKLIYYHLMNKHQKYVLVFSGNLFLHHLYDLARATGKVFLGRKNLEKQHKKCEESLSKSSQSEITDVRKFTCTFYQFKIFLLALPGGAGGFFCLTLIITNQELGEKRTFIAVVILHYFMTLFQLFLSLNNFFVHKKLAENKTENQTNDIILKRKITSKTVIINS